MNELSGFTHESQKSLSIDWYTPSYLFDKLGIEFDLDPCTTEGGVSWIPAINTYSLPQDGLSLPWAGTVWCNPPYGKQTQFWLEKMNQHRDGIALVFARTDTNWFHDNVPTADAVLFIRQRIQFVDGKKKTNGNGVPSGSVLLAWGSKSVNALKRMSEDGWLIINNHTLRQDKQEKPKSYNEAKIRKSIFDIV